ncbi:P-loop containing nucleoside triphosphate hydrolase protein [Dissoconium aciculare CBS 342.82]|uniref:RNA helicase n=1 Tax=Dissoconium aciculare CBS 342.82 TaxID=1314786 RepID=A0A6J3MKJ6_9PEZI|nr:P-loop containing nucleoside triphosphate hydrolase protein [Dissoconium aciculare CBS 342.82]KAF1827487.1 P-loop containing nucleoside triphosphate hydrolase protein [Dissoconium aciculare CBS 342.82]
MPPKFVPRERKHRKIARQKEAESAAQDAGEVPQEVTGKKKKRLQKYIETKLKKEENLELLKKLAAHKVDTSLLQSAKKLGRVHENKRERFQRALKERAAGIDVNGDQDDILLEERATDLYDSIPDKVFNHHESRAAVANESTLPPASTQGFGLGLKRPLEVDEAGLPVIKRRKRRKPQPKLSSAPAAHDNEWNGFDSGAEEDSTASDKFQANVSPGAEADSDNESDNNSESSEAAAGDSDEEAEASDETSPTASDADSDVEDAQIDDEAEERPTRLSAFKAWANVQRNEAMDFTPSAVPVTSEAVKASFTPRAPSPNPDAIAASQALATDTGFRPAAAVNIARREDVQNARLELPVVQDEQKIMEAVNGNPVVIVCGATGSGKTTQIPQILLENGYGSHGMIGVTQPRRIAATSVASRVAYELGDEHGKNVAHQVRYDSNVDRNTKIKFMTDGVLLREISQDFILSKYSVLVIDEAHERSVNTDILIGMLSRIVPLRRELHREQPEKHTPLKLIVMSATLRVSDFLLNQRLFRDTIPPLVQAEGRQYQVTEHFARRTQRDYVMETIRKVSRGHKKLPPGGILVFLTGQDEIQTVAKHLQESFRDNQDGFHNSSHANPRITKHVENDYLENEDNDDSDSDTEIHGLDDYDEDDEFAVEPDTTATTQRGPLKAQVLMLYAALPPNLQKRVFEPAPDGTRNIVLATNVAETSLTIPGIRYVFDCGRSKEKTYDGSTGVQEYTIDWISKASASQRMGRAGRTGPGHCYRLYSSAIFEQYFEEHSAPEILRAPIEGTVLQLKSMDVENVIGFPFPTPPSTEQLLHAERLLKNLGAIDARSGKITQVGRDLAYYPVNPRFGKMLLLGLRNHVLPLTIALVAGLAVGDLFIAAPRMDRASMDAGDDSSEEEYKKRRVDAAALTMAQKRQQAYGRANATLSAWDDNADVIKLLTAVAAHAQAEEDPDNIPSFCEEYFLRQKGMTEVQQLRRQLHNIMQAHVKDGRIAAFVKQLPAPSKKQIAMLKQIVAGGYVDQVAIRADLLPSPPSLRPGRRAIEVPYRTIIASASEVDRMAPIEQQEEHKSVYIHPSSVLSRLSVAEMPPYIIYSELSRATAKNLSDAPRKTRIRPLTTIARKQLAALAEGTPLLDMGKPIGKIEESEAGRRRECWLNVSLRDPNATGTTGWPLGAWKVAQTRKGKDWATEKVISRGTA